MMVASLVLLGAACGSDEQPAAGGGTTSPSAEPTRVAMALSGPKNDQGFNQAHYEGLTKAESELGIKSAFQENLTDPQARIDAIKNLADGNDVVISVGAEFAEAVTQAADQYPDVTFMAINGEPGPPNVYVYGLRFGPPLYVAGVVAANLSTTKKIGFLGGEEIPPLTQASKGFEAGAKATDPSVEYVYAVTGDFNDPAKAKDAAAAQIASGVDVMYQFLNAGATGAVQAIEESGKDVKLIMNTVPQCDASSQILGTHVLNPTSLVLEMIKNYQDKKLPAEPVRFGVENLDIQSFELCPNYEDAALQKTIDETIQGLNSGSITLPEGV
jgi:basic membrane protein A